MLWAVPSGPAIQTARSLCRARKLSKSIGDIYSVVDTLALQTFAAASLQPKPAPNPMEGRPEPARDRPRSARRRGARCSHPTPRPRHGRPPARPPRRPEQRRVPLPGPCTMWQCFRRCICPVCVHGEAAVSNDGTRGPPIHVVPPGLFLPHPSNYCRIGLRVTMLDRCHDDRPCSTFVPPREPVSSVRTSNRLAP